MPCLQDSTEPTLDSVAGLRRVANDPSYLLSLVKPPSYGVMLYGSYARGTAGASSDLDILQIVKGRYPKAYSVGRVNVTTYQEEHLTELARQGSLFIRHLRDEGRIVSDPEGLIARVLARYRPALEYGHLAANLSVLLAASATSGAEKYQTQVFRLAIWAARTALYIRCAEVGDLTFDVALAAKMVAAPEAVSLLRSTESRDLPKVVALGRKLLKDYPPPEGMPEDFPSCALWAISEYPSAARLLEMVIAGAAQIDYTAFTLPLA